MDDQTKQFMLGNLREEYIKFMTLVAKMPGAQAQKQQAFLRFDEGHMWMQNAVAGYVAPAAEEQAEPEETSEEPAAE